MGKSPFSMRGEVLVLVLVLVLMKGGCFLISNNFSIRGELGLDKGCSLHHSHGEQVSIRPHWCCSISTHTSYYLHKGELVLGLLITRAVSKVMVGEATLLHPCHEG